MDGENAVLCLNVIWWEATFFFLCMELINIRIYIDAISNNMN